MQAKGSKVGLADAVLDYQQQMKKFDTGKMAGADTGRGYNQTSASGHPFWALDPRPEDIRTYDIAAQLSRMCRFNGALRDDVEIYTVAQHCCLVSDHCPPELALEGLLHDAHEYMVGDMSKPIKMNLNIVAGDDYWKVLEHRVERVLRLKFGLPKCMTPAVKEQDYIAVATEHRDLQNNTGEVDWGTPPTPWPETIIPWGVHRSRAEFLRRFHALYACNGDCHGRT